MKKHVLLSAFSIATLLSGSAFGQKNLVTNPSFDELMGKVKTRGQIEMATGWSSPSETDKADLFIKGNDKKPDINNPDNTFGREEPIDGDVYAGFMAYSYKEAVPRTYLQTKLEKPLIAGKTYCVRFFVSLSDLSKYAVNNIGMNISAKSPKDKDLLAYSVQASVVKRGNPIYNDNSYWQEVCGTFVAAGGEKYITIGNFEKQDLVKTEKMKRPSEYKQQQTNDAYYFIENVSIVNSADDPECACGTKDEKGMQVVYTKEISSEGDLTAEQKINMISVYFEENQTAVTEAFFPQINELIKEMQGNSAMRIQVVGHSDFNEAQSVTVDHSAKRAEAVKAYIVSKGIDANRLEVVAKKDSEPATDDQTKAGRAQNRRVVFVVK